MAEPHTDRLIRIHRERLVLIEEQIAVAGISADPALIIAAEHERRAIAHLKIERALKAQQQAPLDAPWYDRLVVDWPAVRERLAMAFLVALILLIFLLTFGFALGRFL